MRQREEAAYRCARISELVMARKIPIVVFAPILQLAVEIHAAAFATQPSNQIN